MDWHMRITQTAVVVHSSLLQARWEGWVTVPTTPTILAHMCSLYNSSLCYWSTHTLSWIFCGEPKHISLLYRKKRKEKVLFLSSSSGLNSTPSFFLWCYCWWSWQYCSPILGGPRPNSTSWTSLRISTQTEPCDFLLGSIEVEDRKPEQSTRQEEQQTITGALRTHSKV